MEEDLNHDHRPRPWQKCGSPRRGQKTPVVFAGKKRITGASNTQKYMIEFISLGPLPARDHVLLAHGAGAPMDSPFMTAIAESLAARGLCVHRFEFPYMAGRRSSGPRKPPPRAEVLMPFFQSVIERWTADAPPDARLAIGGKSLGGRVASLIADDMQAGGTIARLVCFGYPFHPPGQPEKLRTAHLRDLKCPALFVQGTQDPIGTRAEVAVYGLSDRIQFHWVDGGNHDLKPPARGGRTLAQELDAAADAVVTFVRGEI